MPGLPRPHSVPALFQVKVGPLVYQLVQGQGAFGSFRLGFGVLPLASRRRVDAARHVTELGPGCRARLLNRDAAPNAQRLADLPLGGRVGPLREERSRPLRGQADPQARTVGIEHKAVFFARFDGKRLEGAVGEFRHLRTQSGPGWNVPYGSAWRLMSATMTARHLIRKGL